MWGVAAAMPCILQWQMQGESVIIGGMIKDMGDETAWK